jgi:hypothetical protein
MLFVGRPHTPDEEMGVRERNQATLMGTLLVSIMLTSLSSTGFYGVAGRDEGSPVEAPAVTYQGNLILDGNNVTTIQGRFDINGSILVEENATLILQDAVVNLIQSTRYEHNITLRNPVNGNPHLQSRNSLITSNLDAGPSGHRMFFVSLLQNSSALLLNTTDTAYLQVLDNATASIRNSTIRFVNMERGTPVVAIDNSTITYALLAGRSCNVSVSGSTISGTLDIIAYGANFSIVGLEPGFFALWDYHLNCSVAVAPHGHAPHVALRNCTVAHWQFDINSYHDVRAHAEITDSILARVFSYNYARVHVVNSTAYDVHVGAYGTMSLEDSTITQLAFYGGSGSYFLSNCTVAEIEFFGGEGYIAGNVTIDPSGTIYWWGTGKLTRNFNVLVKNAYGEPVSNATLTLKSTAEIVVWTGRTDAHGGACFNSTFTDANYTNTLRLEASKDGAFTGQDVTILCNTPLVLAFDVHDVAVSAVLAAKTVVGQGYSLRVDVVVTNRGTATETFNVTLHANATTIGTQTALDVPKGTSTSLVFTWNTSGSGKGNYAVWAYAWPVVGESDSSDNTLTDGWVLVTIPGDVDGDRDVDIFDIVRMAGIYGVTYPDPRYDPNCDLDEDDDVDIFDIVAAAGHYGDSW